MKTRNDVVSSVHNGDNFNVRAEATGFVRYNRAEVVHSGFVSRG